MASGDGEADTVRKDKKKSKRRRDSLLQATGVDDSSEQVIYTENNMPVASTALAETPGNNGSELGPEVDLHNEADQAKEKRKKKKKQKVDLHTNVSEFGPEVDLHNEVDQAKEKRKKKKKQKVDLHTNVSEFGLEVDLHNEDDSQVQGKRDEKKEKQKDDDSNCQNKECLPKGDNTELDLSVATEGGINKRPDPEGDRLTGNFDENGNTGPDKTERSLKIHQSTIDGTMQRHKKKKRSRGESPLNFIDEGNCSKQDVSLTENSTPSESGMFTESPSNNKSGLGSGVDLCIEDDSWVKKKRKKKKKRHMKDENESPSKSDAAERDLSLATEGVINIKSDLEGDTLTENFNEKGNTQADQTEKGMKIDQSTADNVIQRPKKKKKTRENSSLSAIDEGNSSKQEVSLTEDNSPLESGAFTQSRCDNGADLDPEVDFCDKDDSQVKDKRKKKKKKQKNDKTETQSECDATERDLGLPTEGIVNGIPDPEEGRTNEIFSEEGNIQLDQMEGSSKINQNAAENTIQRRKKKKKSRGNSPLDAVDVGNSSKTSKEVYLIENNTPMGSCACSERNNHNSELVLGENLFNKDDSQVKKKRKKKKERYLLDADANNERADSPLKNGVVEGDLHLASKDDDGNEKAEPERVKLESSHSHVERREKDTLLSEMKGDSSRSSSTNVTKKCAEDGKAGLSMVENGSSKLGQMENLANDQSTLDNSTQPRKKKRKSRQDSPTDAIGVSTNSKEVSLLEKCSETPSNDKSELDLGENLSNNNDSQVEAKRIKKKKRQTADNYTECQRENSPSKNGFIEGDLCHASKGEDPKGSELLDSSHSRNKEKGKDQRQKLVSTAISGLEAAASDSVKMEGNTLLSESTSDVIYRCDENGKSALSLAEVRNIRPDPMQKGLRNRMSADASENTGSPLKVAGQSSSKSSAGMDEFVIVDNKLEEVAVDKKLLVLDLNGILVDVVSSRVDCGYKHDFKLSNKFVFKRPFCDEFLQFCFEKFDVGVWSSRTKENVGRLIDRLMGDARQKLLFCWDQSHCTTTGFKTLENRDKPLFLKEIRKLWEHLDSSLPGIKGKYNETNTLLVDDSPYKALRNPAHTAIFPYSFCYRNSGDSSLGRKGKIRRYLQRLADAENVQDFVAQNPFGQCSISKSSPSWEFYSKIVYSDTQTSENVTADNSVVCL